MCLGFGVPLTMLYNMNINMINKKALIQRLFLSAHQARESLAKLSVKQKAQLEKGWDIEHAYYSSALEGSKLDRQEFDKLAETIF